VKLLLVDDDAVLTRAYRDRLSAHGFQVNTAATGAAALSILRSAKPDLVVLDLMLPDCSGVEVLNNIRSAPRLAHTPVVMLANSYGNQFGRQAGALGIEKAFLKSDCSPTVLMAAIDEILQPGLAAAPLPEPEANSAMPGLRAPRRCALVKRDAGVSSNGFLSVTVLAFLRRWMKTFSEVSITAVPSSSYNK
jgi:DNA-binding response OmpR family regulator